MTRVVLTLETVTPMFLGGADQQQPELRPASVRGALRYWLRAALGGVIGDNNLDTLRRLEAEVFGEMERGSAVVVKLSQPSFRPTSEFLLPHRNQGPANAIPASTSFDLTLSVRPPADVKALEAAAWSSLLWLMLGGIGRRSRRGAGSVRLKMVVTVPDEFSADLKTCLTKAAETATDAEALAYRVSDLLDKTRQAFTAFALPSNPRFSRGLPSFSALLPGTRVIVWTPIGTDVNDYKTALMPLMNEMSSLKASLSHGFYDAFGGISPRRASPLHVTAHKLQSEWALVLTHFKAKIKSDSDGNPEELEEFLNDLVKNRSAKPAYRPATTGGTTS